MCSGLFYSLMMGGSGDPHCPRTSRCPHTALTLPFHRPFHYPFTVLTQGWSAASSRCSSRHSTPVTFHCPLTAILLRFLSTPVKQLPVLFHMSLSFSVARACQTTARGCQPNGRVAVG